MVKAACEGDDRALLGGWTPFMKDLFVSWGVFGSRSRKVEKSATHFEI